MGIISDFRAITEVQKLKAGKRANLSMSQIVGLITNMSDARRSLSQNQFDEVYALFSEYRKCKTKLNVSMDDYIDIAIRIIKSFDLIAPYEKYSGGNALEFSFMMQDIRSEITQQNIEEELFSIVDMSGNSNNEYINYLLKNGNGRISKEQAKAFVGVLITSERYGKEEALRRFRLYVDYLMSSSNNKTMGVDIYLIGSIPFLCGLLASNEILSKTESDDLSNHYFKLLTVNVRKE